MTGFHLFVSNRRSSLRSNRLTGPELFLSPTLPQAAAQNLIKGRGYTPLEVSFLFFREWKHDRMPPLPCKKKKKEKSQNTSREYHRTLEITYSPCFMVFLLTHKRYDVPYTVEIMDCGNIWSWNGFLKPIVVRTEVWKAQNWQLWHL